MKLLTMHEWLGPGRMHKDKNSMTPTEILRGFATDLPLGDAIRRIREYKLAYGERFSHVVSVELRLLAVSTIEPLTANELELAGIELVEDLNIDVEKDVDTPRELVQSIQEVKIDEIRNILPGFD